MNADQFRITAEPIDERRCKFLLSQPILGAGGVRRFASIEAARGSPLAEQIFEIPGAGITEVVVSGALITVSKSSASPWTAVGRQVGQAIRAALASSGPPIAPKPHAPPPTPAGESPSATNDDELYERVATVFDQQVNPMVARHGGRVELIDVQDATVLLRMGGGCQGCGMADVTLRQGIEGMLAQFVPEVKGIVDITDHSAGASPYFQAAKK
jgi:Fe-S cluster biogenesis protein NfuA